MSFPARYTGWCMDCETPIAVGESIRYADNGGFIHAVCRAQEVRSTPVCPRCFQATAVNGKCGCDE